MDRDFITGAVLLVVGGLLIASAITGTTGSMFAVFLSPGGLQIRNTVAGTFRAAGGQTATATPLASPTATTTPGTSPAPTTPGSLPTAGTF